MDYLICKALLFLDKMFIVFLISANIRKTLLQENKGDFDVLDRLGKEEMRDIKELQVSVSRTHRIYKTV